MNICKTCLFEPHISQEGTCSKFDSVECRNLQLKNGINVPVEPPDETCGTCHWFFGAGSKCYFHPKYADVPASSNTQSCSKWAKRNRKDDK